MEVQVDTLCLLEQPKEGQQQILKKKTKNENCQKIELHESPTTYLQGDKEDTFTQTCRRDGDGQPGGEDSWQGGSWWTAVPHLGVDKPGGTTGKRDRPTTRGSSMGK